MMKSSLFLAGVGALALSACSHGPSYVVDGPNPPPAKPLYEPYVPVEQTMDDFVVAAGSNTVLFGTDSAELDGRARDTLDRQVAWLRTHRDLMVLVEGHCDERASDACNLKLGRRRARAVVDYMAAQGLGRSRFVARSFGEGKPVVDRPGDVQINRRAVTVVLDGMPEDMSRFQDR